MLLRRFIKLSANFFKTNQKMSKQWLLNALLTIVFDYVISEFFYLLRISFFPVKIQFHHLWVCSYNTRDHILSLVINTIKCLNLLLSLRIDLRKKNLKRSTFGLWFNLGELCCYEKCLSCGFLLSLVNQSSFTSLLTQRQLLFLYIIVEIETQTSFMPKKNDFLFHSKKS